MTKKFAVLSTAVASITSASLIAEGVQPSATMLDSQHAVARMKDIQSKPFFSVDLTLPAQVRSLAQATGHVGFVKASKKDLFIGRLDAMGNKVNITKYQKINDSAERRKRAINQNL